MRGAVRQTLARPRIRGASGGAVIRAAFEVIDLAWGRERFPPGSHTSVSERRSVEN
jgi:hypothetical protein